MQPYWSCGPTQTPEANKVTIPVLKKNKTKTPKLLKDTKQGKKPTETIKGERAYLPIEIVITRISTLKKRDLSLKVFRVRDIESKI